MMLTPEKGFSHARSTGQIRILAYKRTKRQQLPNTSTHQLTNKIVITL